MRTERLVFPSPGRVEILQVEVPPPGPGEVLIRNLATAVSPGTERAVLLQLPNAFRRFPYVPGYSGAGAVEAVGEGVRDLAAGDVVASDAPHEGRSVRRARGLVPVPPGLPPHRAAFAYMAAIALQGVRRARIELGESVLVVGLGLVGQLAAQLARANGAARVYGLERHPSRLEVARRCGIHPHALEEDRLFDVVIEATGFPEAAEPAMAAAAPGGRVVLLGSTRGASTVNLYEHVHRKGLIVLGAHNAARPREERAPGRWTQRADLGCALALLADGRLDVDPLITDRVTPAAAPDLYRRLGAWDPALLAAVIDWSV